MTLQNQAFRHNLSPEIGGVLRIEPPCSGVKTKKLLTINLIIIDQSNINTLYLLQKTFAVKLYTQVIRSSILV